MNKFVVPQLRSIAASTADRTFPLERADGLTRKFTRLFSHQLGWLDSNARFEIEGFFVGGRSRSGKTKEIASLFKAFNDNNALLPSDSGLSFFLPPNELPAKQAKKVCADNCLFSQLLVMTASPVRVFARIGF